MSKNDTQQIKKEQREQVMGYRNRLTEKELLKKSLEVKKQLFELEEFMAADLIMFYIDFRKEVKTEFMIKEALNLGKRVVVPISQVEDKSLLLSELKDYDNELQLGTYDILEPKQEYIRPVDYSELDMVIVPGVAFDEDLNRLGYGGGYYDRFSAKVDDDVARVALAFEIQIVEQVVTGEYDLPVDKIVTEERII